MAGRSKPKWGAGSLAAMGRQGFKELRAALYPDSNIAREAEMGMYGTLTPGEVAEQKSKDSVVGQAQHDRHAAAPASAPTPIPAPAPTPSADPAPAPSLSPSILEQRMSEVQQMPDTREMERGEPEMEPD